MPAGVALGRQRNSPSPSPAQSERSLAPAFSQKISAARPWKASSAKVIAQTSSFMQSESWCLQPCRIRYSLFPTNTHALTEKFGIVTT